MCSVESVDEEVCYAGTLVAFLQMYVEYFLKEESSEVPPFGRLPRILS